MASRKRRSVLHEEDINEPRGAAPNICSLTIEGISSTLHSNRALIRRVFFLNEDSNKYVSVAFYPAQGYTAHVEYGTDKAALIRLTEQQFAVLTEHLPGLIGALCADDSYNTGVHDSFWITTGGSYKTAWMYPGLGKRKKNSSSSCRNYNT